MKCDDTGKNSLAINEYFVMELRTLMANYC